MLRCPGDSCPRWRSAAGDTHEEKSLACRGCEKCQGNAPLDPNGAETREGGDSETEELVDEIAEMVKMQNAGYLIDPDAIGYLNFRLLMEWRAAERQIENIRAARMQAFIKGWFKQG